MAENEKATSSSGEPSSSTGAKPLPRVIGNFTNLGESSRLGGGGSTMKMKFTPNMPIRKNKPEENAAVAQATPAPKTTLVTRDVGRGKGARGRGRGRGGTDASSGAGRGVVPEMVPAGPFAMGPLAAGISGSRHAPSSAPFTAAGPSTSGKSGGSAAKAEGKPSTLPTNRDQLVIDDAPEVYSEDENEEGRIIDLEEVKTLDFMAPDALKKERRKERKSKGRQTVKKEVIDVDVNEPGETGGQNSAVKEEGKNESQALDLSESEEEIELEDLQQYFQVPDDDTSFNSNELYFFQFPDAFPIFSHPSESAVLIDEEEIAERANENTTTKTETPGKRVSFAEDVKASTSGAATPHQPEPPRTEGLIGQLEIHRSGAVRIRMPNNIVFDVFAATRPSFLQQAVVIDVDAKKMSVLGSVTRRFVATPDIDALTASLIGEKTEVMDVDQH
ncbi:hypothetical protein FRC17_010887 [Serendipita sp. 399]|nr:hypothetical protein FRC17_010887 [Serendipita sp. 399]